MSTTAATAHIMKLSKMRGASLSTIFNDNGGNKYVAQRFKCTVHVWRFKYTTIEIFPSPPSLPPPPPPHLKFMVYIFIFNIYFFHKCII